MLEKIDVLSVHGLWHVFAVVKGFEIFAHSTVRLGFDFSVTN